jgi:hypothetical protein
MSERLPYSSRARRGPLSVLAPAKRPSGRSPDHADDRRDARNGDADQRCHARLARGQRSATGRGNGLGRRRVLDPRLRGLPDAIEAARPLRRAARLKHDRVLLRVGEAAATLASGRGRLGCWRRRQVVLDLRLLSTRAPVLTVGRTLG